MALTDDQIATIRDWIGDETPPEDYELEDIYDRLATPTLSGVAFTVLTKRLASFLQDPASYTIEGVYQESAQANITGLQALLRDVVQARTDEETALGLGGRLKVARLVRNGRSR